RSTERAEVRDDVRPVARWPGDYNPEMRTRIAAIAGCLACGCLVKPQPPPAAIGDGGATDGAAPCQPPAVQDRFDSAGSGCGSRLVTAGFGTALRDGSALELSLIDNEFLDCSTAPFDITLGAFIEVTGVNLLSDDIAYFDAAPASPQATINIQ